MGGALTACALAVVFVFVFERAAPWLFRGEPEPPVLEAERLLVTAPAADLTPAPTTRALSSVPAVAESERAPLDAVNRGRSTRRPLTLAAPRSSEQADDRASWEAVARALREGRQADADALLKQLAHSTDPEIRDNAQLVQLRAQLGSRSQQNALTPEQLLRLRQLATQGATASIRASAQKLVHRLTRGRKGPAPPASAAASPPPSE
jgi:hypothetical protein